MSTNSSLTRLALTFFVATCEFNCIRCALPPKVFAALQMSRKSSLTPPPLVQIEERKLADLVLLGADPLDDIRNTKKIEAVAVNGRLLDRKARD